MLEQLWMSIADAGRSSCAPSRRRGGGSRSRACAATCFDQGRASGAALARELIALYARHGSARAARLLLHAGPGLRRRPRADSRCGRGLSAQPRPGDRAGDAPRLRAAASRAVPAHQTRPAVPGRSSSCATQLLGELPAHPELAPVDADLHELLTGWFNPGFLTFAKIDWNSPAALLEKFLRYERVHRMRALEDLKRRLAADRRCFAFFHPALPDEPLIFVEVALVERHGRPDPAPDRSASARSAIRRRPTRRSSIRSTTAWRGCAGSRSATS